VLSRHRRCPGSGAAAKGVDLAHLLAHVGDLDLLRVLIRGQVERDEIGLLDHHLGHGRAPVSRSVLLVAASRFSREVEREHGPDPGAEHGQHGGEYVVCRLGPVVGEADSDTRDDQDGREAHPDDDDERDGLAR
jgi:hypothetical protein